MATNQRKPNGKTPVAEATARVITPEVEADPEMEEATSNFAAAFASYREAMHGGAFSFTKRAILSIVVNVLVCAVGCVAGMYAAAYLGMAAYLLTGWTFLALVVEFMVIALAFIASLYAGGWAAQWVATGGARRDIDRAKGWVKGFFTSGKPANAMVH